ncbi:DUF6931 family protein [Marivita sp. S0852]|uniref:DUF6931 family protein n=1 Tax=Marivita sp. S0852 TaxID=3373893 RepID=UPI0039829289
MAGRFSNLSKVPDEPAAKLLAQQNIHLSADLSAPASASVEEVLDELAAKNADMDLLKCVAVILPPRERVWWACLAARDIVGEGPENETRSLRAAEAWVFRPTDETRNEAIHSMEFAHIDDETVKCAMGVMYSDGTLGTGDMAQLEAPAGAGAIAAFAMNIEALTTRLDEYDTYLHELIDRGIDIARGGNGKPKAQGKDL